MYGWKGTILRVDLTREKVIKEKLEANISRNYIGGKGINSRILYREIKQGIDLLGPDNIVCIATAPSPVLASPLAAAWKLARSHHTATFLVMEMEGGTLPHL